LKKERRKEERTTPTQQPKGKISLYVENQCLDVREVLDVSPVGVGLYFDNAIDNVTDIRLKYQYETIDLEVNGSVVWCMAVEEAPYSEHDTRRYLVGIHLRPDDMGTNNQFFKAITGQQ